MPATETQYKEIGAFEAKTRFSELLRKVDQGERFTVTKRGRAVAQLVPAKLEPDQDRVNEAVRSLLNFPRIEGIPGDTVLEWIREGRK
jgi:prevent-host-death family protein